jgi:hypothetical protein
MGFLNFSSLQVTKMAFTDLIPGLLGQTGTSFDVAANVKSFFNNANPSANLASQFQSFQDSFQSIDFLIGQVRNPVVQLFLNPETINVNKHILLDKKQTRGGFVIQFWGHDLQEIEVKAATAYFEISKEPLAAFELLKRQCFQGRFHPTQPFRGVPIIAMLFESQVLKGYFTDFSYTLTSAQPFQFTYNFRFVVTENVSFVVGNNLTSLVSDVVSLGKQFRLGNVNTNRSDVSIVPENYQFGKGWGVQLF